MTSRPSADSSLDCLDEIEVAGEPALVVWPQLGDAVAVDFKCDGHRYGIVSRLDTGKPKLSPNPLTGRQISEEQQPLVLNAVMTIWAERRPTA